MKKYKQVIIVNKELKMPTGKLAAQVAHASVQAFMYLKDCSDDMYESHPMRPDADIAGGLDEDYDNACHIIQNIIWDWERQGYPKIVLKCANETELKQLFRHAQSAKIPSYIVYDEGRTVFNERKYTAVGIGPWDAEEIDKITGHLKMY